MTYYQRLKELRTDMDKTQLDIANLLSVSQTYYSMYELGKRELPLRHLITLCKFYNVSSDYVLGLPKGLRWLR